MDREIARTRDAFAASQKLDRLADLAISAYGDGDEQTGDEIVEQMDNIRI